MSAAEILIAKLDELIGEVRALRTHSTRELLTRQEAAAILGIGPHRVGALVRRGILRSVPCGKRDKIPREEVERVGRQGLPKEGKPGRPRKAGRNVAGEILAIPIGRE